MKIFIGGFKDLTDYEKEGASDCGSGKEYANYLFVDFEDGKMREVYSDAMEPEDCLFIRDLSWIKDLVERAFQSGKYVALKENLGNEKEKML